MSRIGTDAGQSQKSLAGSISEAAGELASIEQLLGLNQEIANAEKLPDHGDVPRRLDGRIRLVNDLTRRLAHVKNTVECLKEAVG